jgi:hypothetical protein
LKSYFHFLILGFTIFSLAACGPTPSATELPTITATSSPVPAATQTPTENPVPTFTPTAIPTYTVNATVWDKDPYAPVVIFHQFRPDHAPGSADKSSEMKVRYTDFLNYLIALDDAGFTLVPAQDWLNGKLTVPAGRRPIIFTMDDLYYKNQLMLLEDGSPSLESGIGILWDFYKKNPEFGFSMSLFANCNYSFIDGALKEWKTILADTIVWSIEHNVIPYNHTCSHADLSKLSDADVTAELSLFDTYLRDMLNTAGRSDLTPMIANYIGLPFGIWPQSKNTVFLYKNPEGIPTEVIFEAGYHAVNLDLTNEQLFLSPPYFADFDRYRIPRIAVTQPVIDEIVARKDQLPAAQNCILGPVYDESTLSDPAVLSGLVRDAVTNNQCPQGIYYVNGFTFRATPAGAVLILTANQQRWLPPISE